MVSTPGQLDVDIVRNAAERNPAIMEGNRFFQSILTHACLRERFQQFLSENRLSFHAWITGRRA